MVGECFARISTARPNNTLVIFYKGHLIRDISNF